MTRAEKHGRRQVRFCVCQIGVGRERIGPILRGARVSGKTPHARRSDKKTAHHKQQVVDRSVQRPENASRGPRAFWLLESIDEYRACPAPAAGALTIDTRRSSRCSQHAQTGSV